MKIKTKLLGVLNKVKHTTKVVVAATVLTALIPLWVVGLLYLHLLTTITNLFLSCFTTKDKGDNEYG